MQVNIGINNDALLFGGRSFIITTPYLPKFICQYKTNEERKKGMAHFGEIASAFDKHFKEVMSRKKLNNKNGLYMRTLMLFCAYVNIPSKERNPSNAISYLIDKLNFSANSAMVSRNNQVLIELGLIRLIEDPSDARAKQVELTPVGEKFAKLMR